MINDILAGIFGEIIGDRLNKSVRAQLIARLFFGLLGAALAATGAAHFARMPEVSVRMQSSVIALFVSICCFCLFNIALARTWRWPGILCVGSFVALLVSRLVFGP